MHSKNAQKTRYEGLFRHILDAFWTYSEPIFVISRKR
nr:MAG TPA: hypothetical protein [Caudoviricetes sp.]